MSDKARELLAQQVVRDMINDRFIFANEAQAVAVARRAIEAALTAAQERIAALEGRVEALTCDLQTYASETVKLHPLQHSGQNLVKPKLGGSIILWAVEEIAAARAALQTDGGANG